MDLTTLGTESTKVGYAASGELLIEVAGAGKADFLADRLKTELPERVSVSCPFKKANALILSY